LYALAVLGGDLDDLLLGRRPRTAGEGLACADRLGVRPSGGDLVDASPRAAPALDLSSGVFLLSRLSLHDLRGDGLRGGAHRLQARRRYLAGARPGELPSDRASRPRGDGGSVEGLAPTPGASGRDQVHPAGDDLGLESRGIQDDAQTLRARG